MLASISPLGERARGNRWGLTAGAYTAGVVGSAALLGAALGRLGAFLPVGSSAGWLLPAAAVAAGAWDLIARRRVPGVRRQVNEDWLGRYRGWVYGLGFGAQLGVGFATIVTTAAVYAWMVAAVLTREPVAGLLIGACFGLARAAMLGLVHDADDPERLRARLRRVSSWAGRARVGAAAASVVIGAGCAAVVAGGAR